MTLKRSEIRTFIQKIEGLLTENAGRSRRTGGRVMYVAKPSLSSRVQLTPRAQQVYDFLKRNRKASAKALQAALRVNRNVIAGAIHELKMKHAAGVEALSGGSRQQVETAAEYSPRRRRTRRSPR